MMNLSSDDPNTISPEIIGSRCKKFYLLTQDVLKRPDLMLTTIWDCINNVQKTNRPEATQDVSIWLDKIANTRKYQPTEKIPAEEWY